MMVALRGRLASAMLAGAAVTLSAGQPAPTVAIEHVTVVPMDRERTLLDHTVVTRGGRIIAIGPAASADVPSDARRVDGSGKFLLPGLIDVHAHLTAEDLPLFVANGVTTVREMNGSPAHLALQREVASGERSGPALVVASTLVAGVAQRWRHLLVESPAAAAQAAREAAADGYDLLKVYDGLTQEMYASLVSEAARLSLPVAGHIPEAVGLEGVLSAGQKEIEHVEQIAYAVSGHDPDLAVVDRAAQRIADSGAWVVPTLSVIQRLSLQSTADVQALLDSPDMAFLDEGMFGWWNSLRRTPRAPSPMAANMSAFYDALVIALHRRGVPMAAGTDTPNPFMVPGFSLSDEVRALERAGLSSFAAIDAATASAARLLGVEADRGTIEAGKRADLVLLDANPLEDLAALRGPAGVMLNGRWLSRAALGALLDQARRR